MNPQNHKSSFEIVTLRVIKTRRVCKWTVLSKIETATIKLCRLSGKVAFMCIALLNAAAQYLKRRRHHQVKRIKPSSSMNLVKYASLLTVMASDFSRKLPYNIYLLLYGLKVHILFLTLLFHRRQPVFLLFRLEF